MKILFVLPLVSLALSGCGLSTFAQRETDPYILDIIPNLFSPVGISVTDSSRRLVYQFPVPAGTPFADPEGRGRFICADPSPDTAVAVAGSVSGELSATVTAVAPNASGNGNVKGERTSGTSVAALLKRSQGLVWGRDQETIECLNFAAGLIDKREYLNSINAIREKSTEIMKLEIEKGFHVMEVAKTEAKSPELPTKEDSKKEAKQ